MQGGRGGSMKRALPNTNINEVRGNQDLGGEKEREEIQIGRRIWGEAEQTNNPQQNRHKPISYHRQPRSLTSFLPSLSSFVLGQILHFFCQWVITSASTFPALPLLFSLLPILPFLFSLFLQLECRIVKSRFDASSSNAEKLGGNELTYWEITVIGYLTMVISTIRG